MFLMLRDYLELLFELARENVKWKAVKLRVKSFWLRFYDRSIGLEVIEKVFMHTHLMHYH
jgi:hypothetical protein